MEEKSKKVKNDKNKVGISRNKLFLGIIVVVIIISVIVGLFVLNKDENANVNNNQNNNNINNGSQGNNTNMNVDGSNGTIDMNNMENAAVLNGSKENTSNVLTQEKTFEGMKVKNISLKAENGVSNFLATVENTSGKDFASTSIVIKFTNKDGSPYAELEGIIGDVKNGASTTIDAGTTADVINAYDFTIEVLK